RVLARPFRHRSCQLLLGAGLVMLIVIGLGQVPSGDRAGAAGRSGKPAPELVGGGDWINTTNPITIAELKGRIVILDFWTLCCINCIHTLPDLAKLEA